MPKHNNSAISIQALRKIYEDSFEALKGIDLEIPKGSFFGLLGPNGAGKTTTIGILTGLVNLTSGSAYILGHDVVSDFRNSRRLVGLSPQELNFDVFFTIDELLLLQAGYYSISRKIARYRVDEILHQFGLYEKRHSKARQLSGGMKRRVQIAKAIVHDPPIIILDEPTAGVDIELRHMLWDYLNTINKNGKTILLTTHYIEEAESLCDTVAIIDNGNIISQGSPRELIKSIGKSTVDIQIAHQNGSLNLSNWEHTLIENHLVISVNDSEQELPKIIQQLTQQNILIENIKLNNSSLEDVFLSLTGKVIS